MNRIIIIDDEHFVRKGIISLIEWEKIGFEVIGEANNGEDGLEIIKKEMPDVVITDIRMPVFNGLELIKKVKEECPKKPKFIIISGFNDFEYAQQAVRYGVYDFILKPVDQGELEKALINLVPKIEEERQEERLNQRIKRLKLFQKLVLDDESDPDHFEESNILIEQLDRKLCYLIIDMRDTTFMESRDEKFQNAVSSFIDDSNIFIHPYERDGYGVLLFSQHMPKNLNEFEWFLSRLKDYIEKELNCGIFVFSGEVGKGVKGLRHSYDTAAIAYERRYEKIVDEPLVFSEELMRKHIENEGIDDYFISKLIEKTEENNQEEIVKLLDKWSEDIQLKANKVDEVRAFLYQFEQQIFQIIRKMGGDDSIIENIASIARASRKNKTLADLKELFAKFMFECGDVISTLNKEKSTGDIYRIKRFIEENYHQNLTLKRIANQFYMNPVYMGQLFKKTYGVYFKDFLLEVRINHAKKILRQSDLRIYEVAEKVGFGSPDYFVTQFEKMEGVTPSKYRQMILEKS